jgi:hypothetical protein
MDTVDEMLVNLEKMYTVAKIKSDIINSAYDVGLIVDEEECCPYCGNEMHNKIMCCGEAGHSVKMYITPDNEAVTYKEVKELLKSRGLLSEQK